MLLGSSLVAWLGVLIRSWLAAWLGMLLCS
jgi:hypothetical protein